MSEPSRPRSRVELIELYFMEHRAKLIDIAAFLDRLDRAADAPEDFRLRAFNDALDLLRDGKPERARRVLELFSDHSTELVAKAPMQGALGAAPPGSGAAS